MGLADIKSLYGPSNNVGTRGTGGLEGKGDKDILAFETGKGLAFSESRLQGSTPHGTKATGPDVFANIPPERIYDGGVVKGK